MTIDESPNFLKTLSEVSGKVHRNFLYGEIGVKVESYDDIGVTLEKIQSLKRKSKKFKRKAGMKKHMARASAMAMGLSMPFSNLDWGNMTHEEVRTKGKEMQRFYERKNNPHAREILANLTRKYGFSGLVCPDCGESYHGNRKNGKPWCFKCDKSVRVKNKSYTFNDPDVVTKKCHK